jgi:hypothetical protein
VTKTQDSDSIETKLSGVAEQGYTMLYDKSQLRYKDNKENSI